MIEFIKYIFNCFIQAFDIYAGNVDKTAAEHIYAWHGAISVVIYVICDSFFFLKIVPDEWSPFKSAVVSVIPAIVAVILYFSISYLLIKN